MTILTYIGSMYIISMFIPVLGSWSFTPAHADLARYLSTASHLRRLNRLGMVGNMHPLLPCVQSFTT